MFLLNISLFCFFFVITRDFQRGSLSFIEIGELFVIKESIFKEIQGYIIKVRRIVEIINAIKTHIRNSTKRKIVISLAFHESKESVVRIVERLSIYDVKSQYTVPYYILLYNKITEYVIKIYIYMNNWRRKSVIPCSKNKRTEENFDNCIVKKEKKKLNLEYV